MIKLLNALDFRYWFCDCSYMKPYGLVISADCKKHDSLENIRNDLNEVNKAITEYQALKAKQ